MLSTFDFLPDDLTWFLAFDPNGSNKPLKQLSGVGRAEYDAAVARLAERRVDVWTARAGFVEGAPTRAFAHVAGIKCVSIDIDVEVDGIKRGKPCYSSQEQALEALLDLRKRGIIPRISAVVSSGYGLHVWWRLVRTVPPSEWLPAAKAFRQSIADADPKLAVDTTRWVDASGLLRPWPSTNYKNGSARPVDPLVLVPEAIHEIQAFSLADRVLPTALPGIRVRAPRATQAAPQGQRRASTGSETHARTLLPLAELERTCGVLRFYKEQRIPHADEPEWRTALSVVCSAVEWQTAIHEYSRAHPSYDEHQTEDKAARIIEADAPPSCAAIRQGIMGNAEDRSQCAGCPLAHAAAHSSVNFISAFRERRKLGTGATPPSQRETAAEGRPSASADPIVSAADLEDRLGDVSIPSYLGDGTTDNPFYIARVGADDMQAAVFGPPRKAELPSVRMFRPAWWVDRHCGDHSLIAWIKDGETRTGLIRRNALGGMQTLLTALGGHGIAAQADRSPDVAHAINAYTELLQNRAPVLPSYGRCGLTEDHKEFVVGSVVVDDTGEVRRAVPNGAHAVSAFSRIQVAGSLRGGHALLQAVGQAGSTPARFAVLASLGSALLGLSSMTGAMINLYGPRSAGKSVMQKVAASFWGNPLTFMQHGEDTTKSCASYAGALGSLPLIIDEITLMREADLSEFAYMVAMGRPKHANNSDGTPRQVPHGWRLTAIASANRSVRDVVSASTEHSDVDSAKQARILELHCTNAVAPGNEAVLADLMSVAHKNYGLVGLNWARHIVTNAPRLKRRIEKLMVVLRSRSPLCDRYIGATVASVLLAGQELRDLGLWPCTPQQDEDMILAALEENERDVAATARGKFATVAETVRRALMPNALVFQERTPGTWVCLNPADNIVSVKARIELHHDGRVRTIASRSEVARIVRDVVSPFKDRSAKSTALTTRAVGHYIDVLKQAGVAVEALPDRQRLGEGASVRFAIGAPAVCVAWEDQASAATAALTGSDKPRLATVDGKVVIV